ncbi:MAG: cob(I)yrinic acid a,c-diamide adenosyltransferase [Pseudomonadota bacterium]
MKIYTKTGDRGETGLRSGRRVPKDDPVLEAYGAVDELNAVLGVVRSEPLPSELAALLEKIQQELFDLCTDLATPWDEQGFSGRTGTGRLDAEPTRRLEGEIDRLDAQLEVLRRFILPAGTKASALLHLARTVCRRAERRVGGLLRQGKCNPEVAVYLNRLSDWIFVVARTANRVAGVPDVLREKKPGEA